MGYLRYSPLQITTTSSNQFRHESSDKYLILRKMGYELEIHLQNPKSIRNSSIITGGIKNRLLRYKKRDLIAERLGVC